MQSVPLDNFYHVSYPKLTVIVTCGEYEKGNAIAVSWHTPLSFDPPLYGISISPRRYSHKLIEQYGEFAVNFLPIEKVDLIWKVGTTSGRSIDKFSAFGIKKMKAVKIRAPLIADSIAILECKVVDKFKVGDHTFFVGEVVQVWVKEGLMVNEVLDPEKAKHSYYLGEGQFLTLDPKTLRKF